MSTQELFTQLDKLTREPGKDIIAERMRLQSLVLTRIAALYEMDRNDDVHQVWEANAHILDELLQHSPSEAFSFAMELIKLPYKNYNAEFYRGWLRGNGLALLSEHKMTGILLAHLSQPEDADFVQILMKFLTQHLFLIKESKNLADYSMGFNAVSALKLSLHLIDVSNETALDGLRELVQQKLKDPDIHRIVKFFMQDKETRPFVEEVSRRLIQ